MYFMKNYVDEKRRTMGRDGFKPVPTLVIYLFRRAACADAKRAMGTRKGEQLT